MRIAFVPGTFRPERCGVSHYTARLASELRGRGVECLVVTSREAAKACSRPDVVGAARAWDGRLLLDLPSAIHALHPDLLHIQHAAGSYGFRRAAFWLPPALRLRGWRGPIAVTAHEYGWWEWQPRGLAWAWRRLGPWGETHGLWDREDLTLLTGAAAIIVTNEVAAQVVAARLPQLMHRVSRVPIGSNIARHGIRRATARSAVRRESGWPTDALVVTYFGFVHPVKGLETLLAAFREVHAARPNTRLLLIGGAESLALHGAEAQCYEGRLRYEVRRLELEDAVRFTGYLPEEAVSRCLAGSDVGVLPFNAGVTLKSGSLLALWEHGLPVVATRPPAFEPELAEGASLVPPRHVGALAEALGGLLDDRALRQALARRGRSAAAGFSWATIADQHLAIYERLLGAGGPELRKAEGVCSDRHGERGEAMPNCARGEGWRSLRRQEAPPRNDSESIPGESGDA